MPLGAVPFPFGICRICKDKATGLHYGVATCEGCKGFFKRSISKYESFKCYFGDSCDINPKTRSQCKACRFKRCIETGMSVDGVRMGRIPKVEKDKVLEAFHDGGSHYSNHELVVQQTDRGNYRFDLNKTIASTKTTCTTSNDFSHCFTSPVSVTTGNEIISVQETGKDDIVNINAIKSASLIEDVSEIGNDTEVLIEQNDIKSAQTTDNMHTHLNSTPLPEAIDTEAIFKTERNKAYDHYFPDNQLSSSHLFDEIPSEKCENPFNDKFQNMTAVRNNELKQEHTTVPRQFPSEERMKAVDEAFNEFSLSKIVMNSLSNKGTGCDTDSSKMVNQRQKNGVRPYQFEAAGQTEGKLEGVLNACGDRIRPGTSLNQLTPNHSTTNSQKGAAGQSKDECMKKKSFSPTLINVLLEQVLDSEESVNVITERLQQERQQGNLSQNFAQNLSQRISELSAAKKRRRYSDDCPYPEIRKMECLEKDTKNHELVPPDHCNNHHNHHHPHHQADHSHVHCHQIHADACKKCCSPTLATNDPISADLIGIKSALTPVGQGTVSSPSLSMEEEVKLQQARNTLDGINIAMKILNRLKAEHREKIRQFKLGKIYIRVMTNSKEDVEETYSKLISGIPNLNERILGFCNSIPGVHEISKEDQDVLMKRAYYDIWMLCTSEYIQEDKSYIIMETGEIYSQETMRKILNDDIVNKLFEFANRFNNLELTDMEIAILCATRLTSTDGLELKDRAKVNSLHSHLLDVLAAEVKQNHEMDHARKLIDIFRLLPLLETINRIQRDIIAKFSV